MTMLEALYAAGVAAKNSLYTSGRFKPRRLSAPVVSIGNLSVGGSGKTPFTIMLAQMLLARGIGVDVLSRGYGRTSRGVQRVAPDGSAAEFGDEPILIRRKLDVPVFVAAERYEAGLLAEREVRFPQGAQRIHLLDDGFQHRRLHRDFDIVLLAADDLEQRMLPAGRLREPLTSLSRADAIVLTEPMGGAKLDEPPFAGKYIWRVTRSLMLPPVGDSVVAFAGIAHPQRFFADLKRADIKVVDEIAFRDHHRYTRTDVGRLQETKSRHPGATLVGTEKDAVNLGPFARELNVTPIPIRMELVNPEEALRNLLGTLAKRRDCRA